MARNLSKLDNATLETIKAAKSAALADVVAAIAAGIPYPEVKTAFEDTATALRSEMAKIDAQIARNGA